MTGTTLVVAFQKSAPPLIWKFDLERNHSFTLALQDKDNEFAVRRQLTQAANFSRRALCSDREAAEEAFAAVQKALMK